MAVTPFSGRYISIDQLVLNFFRAVKIMNDTKNCNKTVRRIQLIGARVEEHLENILNLIENLCLMFLFGRNS